MSERFRRNEPIETIVRARAEIVDQIILSSWEHYATELLDSADLVAVGGYGRGELHPQSDIDLLVLLHKAAENDADESIGRFLTFLWDIGLEVGHSVRTLDDCEAQARADVTVVTTMMETRLLEGPGGLFEEARFESARRGCGRRRVLRAKLTEQQERHHASTTRRTTWSRT